MSIFVGDQIPAVCIQVGDVTSLPSVPTLGGGPGSIQRGLGNGQLAITTNGGFLYCLMVTDAPVNDPAVLPTADDDTRRWVLITGA